MTRLNISGVLVHAKISEVSGLCARLAAMPEIEIQTTTNNGRIVMLIETKDAADTTDCFTRIQNLDGVLSASLVYHYNDELNPAEEEIAS